MSTYTVTIDVADFVSDGVAPRLAFVTFSRLSVDDDTGEIVTTAPVSVRVTQTPATVQLTAGVTYKVRGDGIAGVGTFYAAATADLSLAALRDSHQVDPSTGALLPTIPTVGAAIAAVQASVGALQAQLTGVVAGAPTLLNTLSEIAIAIGNDPHYSADVAAQLASLTNQVTAITLASLGGLTQTQVDARVNALADLKGAAAAITLAGLGGVTPQAATLLAAQLVAQQAAADANAYSPLLGYAVQDRGDGTSVITPGGSTLLIDAGDGTSTQISSIPLVTDNNDGTTTLTGPWEMFSNSSRDTVQARNDAIAAQARQLDTVSDRNAALAALAATAAAAYDTPAARNAAISSALARAIVDNGDGTTTLTTS